MIANSFQYQPDRAMRFHMAQAMGRIAKDSKSGAWFLDFRSVRFPWEKQPRRVRFSTVKWLGSIESKKNAEQILGNIRGAVTDGRELWQVLVDYLGENAPDAHFIHYWHLFVEAKREDCRAGQIGRNRMRELDQLEGRGYLEELAHVPIWKIKTGTLEDFRTWLSTREFSKGTLSPRTVRHVIHSVGACLRWLHRREDIERMPQIPEVRQGQKYHPNIPTPAVVEEVLAAIPEAKRGIWLVRYDLGLRPKEARRLQLSAWARESRELRLTHTKTGDPRTLPITPRVQAWLEQFAPARGVHFDPLLIQNPDSTEPDKGWRERAERRWWTRACEEVGVKIKPNEGTRHAFATHAALDGYADIRLQKAMGHTDPKTTSRYIELGGSGLTDLINRKRSDPSGQ